MKRFILKTLFLILPIFIAAIVIEFSLRQIPNDYVHKKKYLDKHSQNIQTLILGNSHTFYGLNPVYFSNNTFNASHPSQTLDFDWALFNKYQNDLNSLKTIVLPISYFSLFDKLENTIEDWRVKNYAIYYGIKTGSLSDNFELLNHPMKHNLHRLYSYYINSKHDLVVSELGWGTIYKSEEAMDLQETGKISSERHTLDGIFSDKRTKILEEHLKTLNLFSEFCNQRNIKLIILTTPAYYTYRQNLNAEQYNKTAETINKFVNQHSNCYYLNWMDDTDFVANDFFDADHMNEIGAEKLSSKISNYIDWLESYID